MHKQQTTPTRLRASGSRSNWARPVVKTFNNIYARHLLELGRPRRIALPVSGDDEAAKASVMSAWMPFHLFFPWSEDEVFVFCADCVDLVSNGGFD